MLLAVDSDQISSLGSIFTIMRFWSMNNPICYGKDPILFACSMHSILARNALGNCHSYIYFTHADSTLATRRSETA
jgi:hypothetical protein